MCVCIYLYFFFETGSYYVSQAGLQLTILLSQPEYWNYTQHKTTFEELMPVILAIQEVEIQRTALSS
jgi:hypothetical protein